MLAAFRLDVGWSAALAVMLALTSSNWAPTPPAMIGVVGAVTMAVLACVRRRTGRGLALGTVLNVVLVGPARAASAAIALWPPLLAARARRSARLRLRRAAGLSRQQGDEAAVPRSQEGGHGPA